jgi:two-component system CheB/CheR fusion protein
MEQHSPNDDPSSLEPSSPEPSSSEPIVVGIGASAGGLKALKTFFQAVPPDFGFTFVVVVHLAPDRESHLADLLQTHTKMPVVRQSERASSFNGDGTMSRVGV